MPDEEKPIQKFAQLLAKYDDGLPLFGNKLRQAAEIIKSGLNWKEWAYNGPHRPH